MEAGMARRLVAALALPVAALTTAAGLHTTTVPLPKDFAPEGIATSGHSATFYTGSLKDGDIFRGNLRTGKGAVFIDVSGRQSAGMKVDQRHHRLFVAGAATGHAYVYDTRSGRTLANIRLGHAKTTFVNDVVLTSSGAWFTDSFHPRLFFVPFREHGRLGHPRTLTVTGPASAPAKPPNSPVALNGIAAPPDGRTLIVGHSTLGALFTVNPRTGASRLVHVPAGTFPPGTLDGILLDGHVLWTVENFANELTGIKLSGDLRHGSVVAKVTDADVGGAFEVPTAVARFDDHLALVNARFDKGFPPPFGPGAPAGTTYDVVVIKRPQL
jgi:sugar lactone lactonase YvrE